MKREEYVKTIVVYGKMVNVGIDDYGQCYFIEFVNDKGELQEVSCGTYNYEIEETAKAVIDHRRLCMEIYGEEEYLQMEKEREERLAKQWNQEMRDIVCKK